MPMHGRPPDEAVEIMRRLWRADRAHDPITHVKDEVRARARFHGASRVGSVYKDFDEYIDAALHVIETEEITPTEAATYSTLSSRAIAEKVAPPGQGRRHVRIRLDDIPLKPECGPLHPLRAAKLLASQGR